MTDNHDRDGALFCVNQQEKKRISIMIKGIIIFDTLAIIICILIVIKIINQNT